MGLSLEELRRVVEERGLTPCHVFFASYLAALNAAGILNQALVDFLARHAAETLHAYLLAMGRIGEGDAPEKLVDETLDALQWGEWSVEKHGDELVLRVVTGKCRYCPKGVGRAELPSTACPLPKLLEAMLRRAGYAASVEQVEERGHRRELVKEGGVCVIRYRLQGSSAAR